MATQPNKQATQACTNNSKVLRNLLFVVIAMFGFGFALVPLYDTFCSLTGLNGKTAGVAYSGTELQVDNNREIKVEFVTSLNESMPWEFKASQTSVIVHPGEPTKVGFYARNLTDKDITGQAIPSVAPGLAASYFKKTECFCFTQQTLKAGEEREMPVVFIVDPSIDEDIHEITLSYTFFIKPGSEDAQAANGIKHTIALSTPLSQF
ncbi:MAG: cytochrome c oxidase assembly protein [Gammaproteobacteria bacterium]|nr:cytochrome c oxidase assembly protein [Gammaproteobacteria bacterium]